MEVVCLQSIDLYHQHLLEMQLLLYHKQSELKLRERERERDGEGGRDGGREGGRQRRGESTDRQTVASHATTCYCIMITIDTKYIVLVCYL